VHPGPLKVLDHQQQLKEFATNVALDLLVAGMQKMKAHSLNNNSDIVDQKKQYGVFRVMVDFILKNESTINDGSLQPWIVNSQFTIINISSTFDANIMQENIKGRSFVIYIVKEPVWNVLIDTTLSGKRIAYCVSKPYDIPSSSSSSSSLPIYVVLSSNSEPQLFAAWALWGVICLLSNKLAYLNTQDHGRLGMRTLWHLLTYNIT